MKIGVIADVHDHMRETSKVLAFMEKEGVEYLIHCGDWCAPFSMRAFIGWKHPIRGVLGNGDADIQKYEYQIKTLDDLKDLDIHIEFRMLDLEIDEKRIAVFHGDDPQVANLILESGLYDVYMTGHNHQKSITQQGKTLIINPGDFVGYFASTGIRPRTFAIYDTSTNEAKLIDIDTEKEIAN